ncbi:MAG: lytic transglycosylase domain-containing protein, partial [Longimicrobiales bacterium]
YDEYRAHHPESRHTQQAVYWAARAYLAAGDTVTGRARLAEAAALDPAAYYGMLAADLLGEGGWHVVLAASPATSEQTALETAGAFLRLDVLDSLDLESESAYEMERLKRHFAGHEGAFYALAEGFHDRGQTFTGIRLGRELQRNEGSWNARLLRIVFPFPYRDEIVRYANERGIDPYLVAGLIRQESMFNATVRSSAGAIGLMQIMPPTGKSLARQEGVRFQLAKLREPSFNIRLGTRFVADLLGRYDGRLTFMLAAYNAGPTRVARWRNLPEAAEDDLFAERIPFAETREYVKIVQQNARIYRALYGTED